MIRLLPLLLLAGCSTATLDCADLRQGACKVSFQRFATDTSLAFTGPEGLGFTYSSAPDAVATAAAFKALGDALGIVGGIAGARIGLPHAPVPVVPSQPAEPDDGAAWHPPATYPKPWVIEGVAHAVDVSL